MSAITALVDVFAAFPLVASSDDSPGWLLLAGPLVGSAVYLGLYRYYRNPDKSHDFERETKIESKPVTGNDVKVDEVRRTKRTRVTGDNQSDHRSRVTRVE